MPDLRPSQRYHAIVQHEAWNDTTVQDLLADFLDAHPTEAETFIAFVRSRTADADSMERFEESFGPVISPGDGGFFDFEEIVDIKEQHVWTVVEADEGLWLVAGVHRVNRIGYLRSERPWATGNEEFRYGDTDEDDDDDGDHEDGAAGQEG